MSNPSITSPEDPYAFLSSFDTVFPIDDSGSMQGRSWQETKKDLLTILLIYRNITSYSRIESLFRDVRPSGGTPTATRINQMARIVGCSARAI